VTRRVVVPSRRVLEDEIEFAIAYTRACNPGRDLTAPDTRRMLAEAIVWSLFERAEHGATEMRMEEAVPGNAGGPAGMSS
jgi:hypothetical protein